MDKQTAFRVLVENSYFLPKEAKQVLLVKLPTLTDSQIDELGRFLALEQRQSLMGSALELERLDQLIQKLSSEASQGSEL